MATRSTNNRLLFGMFPVVCLAWAGSISACVEQDRTEKSSERPDETHVYVKIIIPMKPPAEREHPRVESWIARKLKQRGNTELRAITQWVRIAGHEEDVTSVWDATVDGRLCGCPVVGQVSKPRADGKVKVQLTGWSPVGAEVRGNMLPAEAGSRRISVVDTGRADGLKYYVAMFVGPASSGKR